MAITLQVIKDRMQRRLGDINNVSNELLYDMATDLNQFLYRTYFGLDPEKFITSTSFSIPAASMPYTAALPAGFRDVQEAGTGFFVQDTNGANTTMQLGVTGFGAIVPGYYFSGSNVVFTGISQATTVILRYIPVLSDLTSLNSTFIVPDEFKDLVLEGMILAYYKNKEDPREGLSDQRFVRLLEEFETAKKGPEVYGLPSPYNDGYNTLYPFAPFNLL